MHENITIIAEVKTQSPFGWESEKTWDELFAVANGIGDMISIHTDARWGGSCELITKAKAMTGKPILAKGIHATDDDVQKAIDAGADFVLVVGRIPEIHKDKCLVEPLTFADLKLLPHDVKAVWNSRDLSDGSLKKESFAQARAAFPGWLCQASNIRTIQNVHGGADAALIGTHLEEFARSLEAMSSRA